VDVESTLFAKAFYGRLFTDAGCDGAFFFYSANNQERLYFHIDQSLCGRCLNSVGFLGNRDFCGFVQETVQGGGETGFLVEEAVRWVGWSSSNDIPTSATEAWFKSCYWAIN
jgi:hypothetical protein